MVLEEYGHDTDRLLAAIPKPLRSRAEMALTDPRVGGRGLRAWANMLETAHRPLPESVPAELVEVFLEDSEAEPLHDCERCGLPMPVRAGWRAGHEPMADRVYFPMCPHCGGRTGQHAFWARGPRE